ncbi:MAG: class I SAM-dependent methyltransferase [Lutibacter sp.]
MKKIFKFFLNRIPRPVLIKVSYWLKPFLVFWYRGNQFTDPIDGKNFKKLLPYGYGITRENALSPSTLSLERHRLIWLYLKNETAFFKKNLKVLHIAPEQCFYNKFKKQKNLDYLTADLNSPIADVKADICNLPFQTESFDVVICNHVLEHILDDEKAMSELYRVLKPKGFGIFQVPLDQDRQKTYEDLSITSPKEREKHFGQYDHVRIYGLDYFTKLKNIGFMVEAINYSKKLGNSLTKKYALTPNELLPVCSKN